MDKKFFLLFFVVIFAAGLTYHVMVKKQLNSLESAGMNLNERFLTSPSLGLDDEKRMMFLITASDVRKILYQDIAYFEPLYRQLNHDNHQSLRVDVVLMSGEHVIVKASDELTWKQVSSALARRLTEQPARQKN
ncbi:hypothetical protein ACKC9G_07195 [Pokkaliibacter sp. CJK22405]|uniref:hypothetical protein n=1 Tax=Pokkaliibacter sp. CJK22405 TaxID=3384615 RepID=UPI0039854E75